MVNDVILSSILGLDEAGVTGAIDAVGLVLAEQGVRVVVPLVGVHRVITLQFQNSNFVELCPTGGTRKGDEIFAFGADQYFWSFEKTLSVLDAILFPLKAGRTDQYPPRTDLSGRGHFGDEDMLRKAIIGTDPTRPHKVELVLVMHYSSVSGKGRQLQEFQCIYRIHSPAFGFQSGCESVFTQSVSGDRFQDMHAMVLVFAVIGSEVNVPFAVDGVDFWRPNPATRCDEKQP